MGLERNVVVTKHFVELVGVEVYTSYRKVLGSTESKQVEHYVAHMLSAIALPKCAYFAPAVYAVYA